MLLNSKREGGTLRLLYIVSLRAHVNILKYFDYFQCHFELIKQKPIQTDTYTSLPVDHLLFIYLFMKNV